MDELLDYANDRADEMNVINLATCMHRLGRLNAARNRGAAVRRETRRWRRMLGFVTLTNRLCELLIAAQDGTLEGKGLGTFKVSVVRHLLGRRALRVDDAERRSHALARV